MAKIIQEELNKILWSAADSVRGVVDAGVFKDYVLALLFYKYMSDMHKAERAALVAKYGEGSERIEMRLKKSRFVLPSGASFYDVYAKMAADNVGELLNQALRAIEDANEDKLKGVFTVDFNSQSILGQTAQRNKMIRDLLTDFNKVDLSEVGEDILGNSYMFMIERFGADAGKKAGEFFTPHTVAALVAKLADAKSGDRICDPACGSGSLLLLTAQEVGGNDYALYGQEKTGTTYNLARMNMFLHGVDSARIEWGDTLNNPLLREGDDLMKFDIVVANPPFSLDKWGDKSLENDRYNRFHRGMPPASKGDYAFLSHMIETAKAKEGRVVVVVPHGVLFRGSAEGKIRQALTKENLLDAVIGLPSGLFQTTGIPVAIMVFDRTRETGGKNEKRQDVLFIDASKEFTTDKKQNVLSADNIARIVETYRKRAEIDKFSHVAKREEIIENDYNLNIPRYVDTFEEEPEIDIAATQQKITELEAELAKTQQKMQEYLKELGLK